MHSTVRRAATAALTAGVVALPFAAPAAAVGEPVVLAEGLVGPLDLSVAPDGGILVAESFRGALTRVAKDGTTTTVASVPDGFLAGVDARRSPQRAYVASGGFETNRPYTALVRVDHRGRTSRLADLLAYETEKNPDGRVRYGFRGLEPACAEQVPDYAGGPEGYDGIVESNPYAVAAVPGGWVVADAAGNTLISVRSNGAVSTLAVLPTFEQVITQEMVDAANEETAAFNDSNPPEEPDQALLPDCVAGETHVFEPVPTDVELGRDGKVYVSTLTGGPESPAFGARSRIFRVDRRTGSVTQIGGGFAAAVDLAVTPEGAVYVAELFGGQISKLVNGGPQTVLEVPLPGAVEFAGGRLYATTDIFNEQAGGSLITFAP